MALDDQIGAKILVEIVRLWHTPLKLVIHHGYVEIKVSLGILYMGNVCLGFGSPLPLF